MAEQALQCIHTAFSLGKMRGKAVAEHMGMAALPDACCPGSTLHDLLDGADGEGHASWVGKQPALVSLGSCTGLDGLLYPSGNPEYPVLVALSLPHPAISLLQLQILYFQVYQLTYPQSDTIHQRNSQMVLWIGDSSNELIYLFPAQEFRQAPGLPGIADIGGEMAVQHLPEQEGDGVQLDIDGASRAIGVPIEVIQDILLGDIFNLLSACPEEPLDAVHIGLHCPAAVLPSVHLLLHLFYDRIHTRHMGRAALYTLRGRMSSGGKMLFLPLYAVYAMYFPVWGLSSAHLLPSQAPQMQNYWLRRMH